MAFSGGTFSLVAGNPVVTGTTISSTTNNNTLSDIASNGLTLCILKDGSQTLTADIPMSSFKLTGLAAGSAAGHSVRYQQVLLLDGTNTMAGNLIFTDATYDIGATGATRPRDFFLSRNAVIGGTLSLGGNVVSNLLFTDATYDIGASGATRPRDLFLSRNGVIGGTLGVTGTLTATGAVSAATITGAMVSSQAQVDAGTSAVTVITPSVRKVSLLATQATTSGTAKDFTIPAGAREIVVNIVGVSTDGTSNYLIQIGDSGGIETTGYVSGASDNATAANSTAGFIGTVQVAAAGLAHGQFILRLVDAATFTWTSSGGIYETSSGTTSNTAGSKSLSAELTTVRVTTVTPNNFDAGLVGCSYIL